MDENVEITDEMLIAEEKPQTLLDTFDPLKDYEPADLDLFADAYLSKERKEEREEIGKVASQVLLYLRDHRFGHIREIAASRGVSDSAVRKNMAALIHKGWIRKAYKKDRAQYYELVADAELPQWIDLPVYLSNIELRERVNKEVFTASDTEIDPAVNSGLYKRVWVPKSCTSKG